MWNGWHGWHDEFARILAWIYFSAKMVYYEKTTFYFDDEYGLGDERSRQLPCHPGGGWRYI